MLLAQVQRKVLPRLEVSPTKRVVSATLQSTWSALAPAAAPRLLQRLALDLDPAPKSSKQRSCTISDM